MSKIVRKLRKSTLLPPVDAHVTRLRFSPASLSSLFLQTPQIIIVVVVSEWPVFMLNADIAVHLYLSVSMSFKCEFFVTVSL